jgi:polyketide synthase PksN
MIDFIQYIFDEVKSKRLSKKNAMDLIRQFKTRGGAEKTDFIHPLLHENTSDLFEQRFRSTFSGHEFFLKDHIVKGRRVLPGVAYLEMARAAVEKASRISEEGVQGIQLRNIVWARPLTVNEGPVDVHIGIVPEDSGEMTFKVYSKMEEGEEEALIHSQGMAVVVPLEKALKIDIKEIQAEFNKRVLTSRQCYEIYRAMGIEYGPGHQAVEEVFAGQDKVLVKLSLSDSVGDTLGKYVMHPGLVDSALQGAIGLALSGGSSMPMDNTPVLKPYLPFALNELRVFGNCTRKMWALVGYSDGSKAEDRVQKLDIDLYDDQGNLCVQMKGYTSRVLEGDVAVEGNTVEEALILEPVWIERDAPKEKLEFQERLVFLCKQDNINPKHIEEGMEAVRCVAAEFGTDDDSAFQRCAIHLFREIKGILSVKHKGKVLIQVIVPSEDEQQLFVALSGLLKTASLENNKLVCQLIEVEGSKKTEELLDILKENSGDSANNQIKYNDGNRYVADWNSLAASSPDGTIPWKDKGVYLITGGAGGLGLIFARDIAEKAKETVIILTGRSPLNSEKKELINRIEALGAKVEYRQTDITDKQSVLELIRNIKEDMGALNGIIHSAGVIKDNFIIKKNQDEFLEVLAPKVIGLKNLDYAVSDMKLDFFILFSSIAASFGNAGQADYSTANAFLDAYADYRNGLVASKQRFGKTLSINWTMWKDGGMKVDEN